MMRLEAIGRNNKIYFGNNIPSMFMDNGVTGATVASNKKVSGQISAFQYQYNVLGTIYKHL